MPFMYVLVPFVAETWTGTPLRAFQTHALSARTPVGYRGREAYDLILCNNECMGQE